MARAIGEDLGRAARRRDARLPEEPATPRRKKDQERAESALEAPAGPTEGPHESSGRERDAAERRARRRGPNEGRPGKKRARRPKRGKIARGRGARPKTKAPDRQAPARGIGSGPDEGRARGCRPAWTRPPRAESPATTRLDRSGLPVRPAPRSQRQRSRAPDRRKARLNGAASHRLRRTGCVAPAASHRPRRTGRVVRGPSKRNCGARPRCGGLL